MSSPIIAGFDSNTFNPSGPNASISANLGFVVNLWGLFRDTVYINENGNLTLDSGYGNHSHPDLASTGRRIIAPFFSHVDVYDSGGVGSIKYGQGVYGGHDAFGVTWIDVPRFYDTSYENLNTFQVVLVARGDPNGPLAQMFDVDVIFNYETIQWASESFPPLVGVHNHTGYELPGSGVAGALLDGGPNALSENSCGTSVVGRYILQFRDGNFVVPGCEVPTGLVAADHAHTSIWSLILGSDHRALYRDAIDPTHTARWASPHKSSHIASWTSLTDGAHATSWTLPLKPATHGAVWADAPRATDQHGAQWADAPRATDQHGTQWADAPRATDQHSAQWADSHRAQRDHRSPWAESLAAFAGAQSAHQAAWADAVATLATHQAAWADAPAGISFAGAQAERRSAWGDAATTSATHGAAWTNAPAGVAFAGAQSAHQAAWADAFSAQATHGAAWADAPADAAFQGARSAHRTAWADAFFAQATHGAAWADAPADTAFTGAQSAHRTAWNLLGTASGSHRLRYAIADRHYASGAHADHWQILPDITVLSVEATPQVEWRGVTQRVIAAELSADEGSPIWIAERIVLADADLWQRIEIGDSILFSIGPEVWTLRVDGKGFDASHPDRQYSISAVSPLAWLGEPYAERIDLENPAQSVSAQAMVSGLLASVGAVDWQIADWQIPRGTLAINGATPLEAARAIAAAVGALVESAPDGTPIVRARHPISVPHYDSATPDHHFGQSELFAASATAAPYSGMNRVIVSNERLVGDEADDRIEFDREDDYSGTVRAWPRPPRAVVLGHTGHPETVIDTLGAVDETIEELVEFVDGEGSVQYPVHSIESVEWQHVDLGDVRFLEETRVQSSLYGHSLARITYKTRSIDWDVALERDEYVQFVLI